MQDGSFRSNVLKISASWYKVARPQAIVVNARLASGPTRSPTKLGLPGRGGQLWWDDRAARHCHPWPRVGCAWSGSSGRGAARRARSSPQLKSITAGKNDPPKKESGRRVYLWISLDACVQSACTLVSHYRNYTFDVKRSSAQVVLVHNQVCECFVTCHGDAQLVGQLPCA